MAQSDDMKHFLALEVNVVLLLYWCLIRIGMIDIVDFAVFIPVYLDIFRQQGIQADYVVPPVPDDLRVGIAPQKQMHHHDFAVGKAAHFRIRLSVKDLIQRVVNRSFLAVTIIRIPVKMQRKRRDRFRKQSDAGVHGGDLER